MANDFKGYATRLPWRITEASDKKGREIVGADGSTVAKLTGLDLPNAELIVESVNNRRAPSSATTAGERQGIDTPEFRELLDDCYKVIEGGQMSEALEYFEGKLIAHIDTWAARSAGDAVLCREAALEVAGTRLANWLFGLSVAQAMPDTWRKTCAELVASWNSVVRGAAPAPGNTAQPTAYDTMDHDQLSKLGQQQKGEHA
jgi:hypothetical protein